MNWQRKYDTMNKKKPYVSISFSKQPTMKDGGYYSHNGNVFHIVERREDGWSSYSMGLRTRVLKAKGIPIGTQSIEHKDHFYIGKKFIDEDLYEKTIETVWEHFGFGNYFIATYSRNGSHGTFTIQSQGTAWEKKFGKERGEFIEKQLKE